jgi:hypothetical protein
MCWLQGEPSLEDVLADPTVHALMARDAVDAADFRLFLENVRSALQAMPAHKPKRGREAAAAA